MEQTRPCLPAYYRERGYRRPGRHFPASERPLPHREDSLSAYPGHVISAIRTSVPLHRSEEQPWAAPNSSQAGRAALRGSRHSQGPRHSAKADKRYGLGHCCLPWQRHLTAGPSTLTAKLLGAKSDFYNVYLVGKAALP